ncbi:MAG: hypothetical protein GXO59_01385 [Dictyoglomi bacterium]|nr:hypothetical protein [Dictyoglomota bacterium]
MLDYALRVSLDMLLLAIINSVWGSINSLGMWIVLATTSYYVRLYDDKGMWKIIEHDG